MVLPVKIFEIQEEVNLGALAARLKGYREEAPYELLDGGTVSLVTEVLDVAMNGDVLSGVFSKDFIRSRQYRREPVENPLTEEAAFWIKPFQQRSYLVVTAPSVARGVKKLLTSHVANQLSAILFARPWAIVEAKVTHTVLQELHEANPQATKLIWFDNVDIPGVNKLCLAGSGLADTQLYHDYLDHGTIWYVVFEVQARGIVVGVTRNCVVTLFSKSTIEDFLTYILDDVLPLIE